MTTRRSSTETKIYRYLTERGFSPPYYVAGLHSLSLLVPTAGGPGIYVLHFTDGTRYIGQSIAMTRRFLQHTANYGDIAGVSVLAAAESQLDEAERGVIAGMERLGVRLRNVQFASHVSDTGSFDETMSHADQERWASDPTFTSPDTPRRNFDGQRIKYSDRFRRWKMRHMDSEISTFLAQYLAVGIPAPNSCEGIRWAASCLLPRVSRAFSVHTRINVGWQEVCAVWSEDDGYGAYFQLRHSTLRDAYGDRLAGLRRQILEAETYPDAIYSPGGRDQVRVVVPDLSEARRFITLPPVALSIRLFNLSLCRKGRSPMGGMHCPQITDMCLATKP